MKELIITVVIMAAAAVVARVYWLVCGQDIKLSGD